MESAKLTIRLSRKIADMEKKADTSSAKLADRNKNESMAINNVIKIEGIQKDLEQLKTQLAQVKADAQLDLHSTNTARWFKTKFESNLQCPESRRYIKDTVDSKLLSFQVNSHSFFHHSKTDHGRFSDLHS